MNIDAKQLGTKFERLLKKIEAGEEVIVTKDEMPVAKLVHIPKRKSRQEIEEAIRAMKKFGKRNRLDGLRIRDLIEEGRR